MEQPARLELERPLSRQALRSLAFSADGAYLAVAGDDLVVRVFETRGWAEPVELVGHFAAVTGLRFAAGRGVLASVSADHTLRVWRDFAAAQPEKRCTTVQAHTDAITGLCFAGKGTRAVTCGADGRIYAQGWSAGENPRLLRKEPEGFSCLAASPSGELLLAGTVRGRLLAMDAVSAKTLFSLAHRAAARVVALCVPAEGVALFAAYADDSLQEIDLARKAVLREFAHRSGVMCLEIALDSQTLFVADREGGIAFFSPPSAPSVALTRSHSSAVTALALHALSGQLASVDTAGKLCVWSLPRSTPAPPPIPAAPAPSPAPQGLIELRVTKISEALTQLTRQLQLMEAMVAQSSAQLGFVEAHLARPSYK